ncbi:MAG TPA: DUF6599 family protein [Acidobacteriota bacterium]|nr:DUF6599 family protein [Acidobacteriota bacterium]
MITQPFQLTGFRSEIISQPVLEKVAQATGLQAFWLREFILVSVQSLSDVQDKIRIDALEMIDPPGAFGLFTLAGAQMPKELPIGNGARSSENELMFWKGSFFIMIRGAEPAVAIGLADHLASQVARPGQLPLVVELLPRKNLDISSIKFFVKDLLPHDGRLADIRPLLSLDKSVQAAIGRYRPDGKRLIVLGYPTPSLALESFERINGYVRDKSHEVYAKRAGVVLALTEGMTEDQAFSLLDQIHYTPSIKWLVDKRPANKYLGKGVPFLLNTVLNSLAFSFFFILGTASIGVVFGVLRFYLRIRPENFFDRSARAGIIRLKIVDK